jgi:hypothetical protein
VPDEAAVYQGQNRRIARWEHEDILDVVQQRLEGAPEAMKLRRQTVEHVFGTLKAWMGSSHFLTRDAAAGANRDELAGSGLQPEAHDQDSRRPATDDSDEGVGRRALHSKTQRAASSVCDDNLVDDAG